MTPARIPLRCQALFLLAVALAPTAWASPLLPAAGVPAAFPDGAVPAAAVASSPGSALAGAGGAWSAAPGFHSVGVNDVVRDGVAFDDGSGPAFYIGGGFTQADAAFASRVAKWTAAGGWEALGAGVNNEVECLAVFDDGGGPALYAGGFFTTAGGVAASRIAKWDGSAWSPVGGGMDNTVFALAVYDDGSGPALYAGGSFTTAGGVAASRIAKWNGSTWSALGTGVDPGVRALHVWDDGGGPALYVAGFQTTAGGAPASFIAKWKGGAWSALGSGLNGSVEELISFDDGSGSALYAGGSFTTAGGSPANRVARWKGGAWSALGAGFDSTVLGLQVFDAGGGPAFYASGSFGLSGGAPLARIARWNGSAWLPIGPNAIDGAPSYFVAELAIYDDGAGERLMALGYFDRLGSAPSTHVAAWDGAAWAGVTDGSGRGTVGWVASVATIDLGSGPELHIGGDFRSAGGIHAPHIANWNGSQWQSLGAGVDKRVNDIVPYDAGGGPALHAGGEFFTAGGASANLVAQWSGAAWSPLSLGCCRVSDLAGFDDGSGMALYAGGQFGVTGGANVARWNGSSWSAVGGGLNDWVMSLAVYDGGDGPALYAGGPFRTELGGSVSWFAKWDGAAWTSVPGAPNGWLAEMRVIQTGGGPVLVVAGDFSLVGGGPANDIAMWDGITWSALGTDFSPTGIAGFPEGGAEAIYAMGRFAATPAGRQVLAKWDGSAWLDQGISANSTLATRLAAFDDGGGLALWVGGTFTELNGLPSAYIGKLKPAALLKVPPVVPVAEGGSVEVPVLLEPPAAGLAAVAFSLDYDQHCLDPDVNHDGVLDGVTFAAPGGFTTLLSFDPLDTDGEIDVAILDLAPPLAALPAGELARIRFQTTCPVATTPVDAAVGFSTSPAPTFGDLAANDVPGSSTNGVVRILPGPRGDCNGNSSLAIADLSAIALEIFDGDGSFWLDAPNPTYAGSPVGCDANASTQITAADVTCANLLLFGGACAPPPLAEPAASAPLLEVSTRFEPGMVWLRGRLEPNGAAVGSLAFSLDLDPARFGFAAIDANQDGTPDHLRFPQGAPGLAFVSWSAGDPDGELDVLLASLSGGPLPGGLLVEVGVPAAAAQNAGYGYSGDPMPSFGSVAGGDLPGIAVLGNLLFSDGFESGTTGRWSLALP